MGRKQICLFADPVEFNDFLLVKNALGRKTDSDTIRAMIQYCKKNLLNITSIEVRAESNNAGSENARQ